MQSAAFEKKTNNNNYVQLASKDRIVGILLIKYEKVQSTKSTPFQSLTYAFAAASHPITIHWICIHLDQIGSRLVIAFSLTGLVQSHSMCSVCILCNETIFCVAVHVEK